MDRSCNLQTTLIYFHTIRTTTNTPKWELSILTPLKSIIEFVFWRISGYLNTMRRSNIYSKSIGEFESEVDKVPKSEETRSKIELALQHHFLFKVLEKHTFDELINVMTLQKMSPGDQIIKQGEVGDKFYVVESGKVEVVVDEVKVGQLEGPTAFGELALMYNSPRAATIICKEKGNLWVTGCQITRGVLVKSAVSLIQNRISFLQKVELFGSLSKFHVSQIAAAMEKALYKDNELVVVEGESGSMFYVIEEGTISVQQQKGSEQIEVAKLTTGDFFGERALIKNEPRGATCIAVNGDVTCFVLDRSDFNKLLGPLEELLKISTSRESNNTEKLEENAIKLEQSESAKKIVQLEKLIDVDVNKEVRVLRTIGIGTFGRVKLIEFRKTKRVMAMKYLQKSHICATHQETNVLSEKTSLTEMDHPYILKLFGTWQDENIVYMFLEFVQGGELWSLLYQSEKIKRTRLGGFDVNTVRMYSANILLGISHIHECGFAYRDLKPENLLLDNEGYLKIVDFGFTKRMNKEDITNTLCGTPEYLSPEIVLAKGHNRSADFWAMGILTYELVCGGTPFADPDQSKIFMKIVNSRRVLNIPESIPEACSKIISRFLNPNPTLRLGMLRGGMLDVKSHDWFGGINWDKMYKKSYVTPYIPEVLHQLDLTHFDEYQENENTVKFTGDQTLFKHF